MNLRQEVLSKNEIMNLKKLEMLKLQKEITIEKFKNMDGDEIRDVEITKHASRAVAWIATLFFCAISTCYVSGQRFDMMYSIKKAELKIPKYIYTIDSLSRLIDLKDSTINSLLPKE